jgi:CcmD family protein
MIRRTIVGLCALLLCATAGCNLASQSANEIPTGTSESAQPAQGPDVFVPISELPPGQQLPAAPFLIVAYAFIWVGLMVYLWSIWRRLEKVEREMRALEQRSVRGETR